MKKPLKIVPLFIFSILFYFLLSTNKGATELKNHTESHTEFPEKQKVKSFVSKDCIVLSTRTNVPFSFSKNNLNTTFKTFHNSLFVHTKTIERIFTIAYTQYNFYAKNVLPGSNKPISFSLSTIFGNVNPRKLRSQTLFLLYENDCFSSIKQQFTYLK